VITTALTHSYRPFVDNVTSSIHETFRVACADVAGTRLHIQPSVVGIDDVNDLVFITADTDSLVLTRRRSKCYNVHNYASSLIICSVSSLRYHKAGCTYLLRTFFHPRSFQLQHRSAKKHSRAYSSSVDS